MKRKSQDATTNQLLMNWLIPKNKNSKSVSVCEREINSEEVEMKLNISVSVDINYYSNSDSNPNLTESVAKFHIVSDDVTSSMSNPVVNDADGSPEADDEEGAKASGSGTASNVKGNFP